MPSHTKAIRDAAWKASLEALKQIPPLNILVEGINAYSDSIANQKKETLLEQILPHIEEISEFSTWFKSPAGRDLVQRINAAVPNANSEQALRNMAQRIILGPHSPSYHNSVDLANAVVAYYQQRGRFGSVSRDIYADLPIDAMIGTFKTPGSVYFCFYMCHDQAGQPCGRNSRDLRDTDSVIARVYQDNSNDYAAVVNVD